VGSEITRTYAALDNGVTLSFARIE